MNTLSCRAYVPLTSIALSMVVLVVVLMSGPALAGQTESSASHAPLFPDFDLPVNTGGRWQSTQVESGPRLIMFWATWCPYCRRLFPEIQALHEDFAKQGLQVLAINIRDDGDTIAYAKKHGLDFPILLEGDELAAKVGVKGTPTVVVIDSDNRVRYVTSNSDPQHPALRNAVRQLIGVMNEGADASP